MRVKKNPFMSLWLSGANMIANTARVRFQSEARRQQAAIQRETSKAATNFWLAALKPIPVKSQRKGR